MNIDNINLNHIRIFDCVYRTCSMTKAASELHMTQSGVSQHVKTLEEVLQVKFFERVKQKLVPTQRAHHFFAKTSHGLNEIQEAIYNIHGSKIQLTGDIHLGIPAEFGNNIILPLIAQFSQNHSAVNFRIKYGPAMELEEQVVKGKLQLAFVDQGLFSERLKAISVYEEILHLCVSKDYLQQKFNKNFLSDKSLEDKKIFQGMDYVDYSNDNPLIKNWFKNHYPLWNIRPRIRATLMNVQGVADLIADGLGAGPLPEHFLKNNLGDPQRFLCLKGRGPLVCNNIYLIFLADTHKGEAEEAIIDFFISSLVNKYKNL